MATVTVTRQLLELQPGDRYPDVPDAPGLTPHLEVDRIRHAPDSQLVMCDPTGTVIARCSCWWKYVPLLEGKKVGVIGHYAATGLDEASALLSHACTTLASAGCALAVGPMDGSTWRSYRVVTQRGTEAPFFLEPMTPDTWPAQWAAAGFGPVAEYTSAATTDLSREDPRIARAQARLHEAGISIRPLDAVRPERDLRSIFGLCVQSFERSFLNAPIDEAEFMEQYRALLPVVRPDLVLVAEQNPTTLATAGVADRGADPALRGFLFAVPDVLQARRGEAVDTIVIKTVAVSRGWGSAGLGSVLVARAHRIARELGFRRAIHALMHERNVSQNISRRYASTIRRYALLGKRLR